MNTMNSVRWEWIGLYLPFLLFIAWKLFRISRSRGGAGAVLLDLGPPPISRHYRWGFAALVGVIPLMFLAFRLPMLGGHLRNWFEDFLGMLLTVAVFVYPTGLSIFLSRKLCERGILSWGEVIPWTTVTGWKVTPRHGLRIDFKDPTWGSDSLTVPLEHAGPAAEILAQHATLSCSVPQPSVP
jgi:hypothetical protein